ncbi:MAG TPA: hypothetical protein VGO67_14705 [Verrucomicrobiae bacterium]
MRAAKGRRDAIAYFLESDKFWPPLPSIHSKFDTIFRRVLSRLPQDVFDVVESNFIFVFDCPELDAFALNVPPIDPPPEDGKTRTIVIFSRVWEFDSDALTGLLAHEIAHSFVPQNREYVDDEAQTNATARKWGFKKELVALQRYKKPQSSSDKML